MNYRIGQRVRLLHASGEGVIVALIDKKTVEVDMGDDFPVDVNVDEIIPIDRAEAFYLGDEETTPEPEKKTNSLKTTGTLGISLIELSLVVYKHEGEDLFEVLLIICRIASSSFE